MKLYKIGVIVGCLLLAGGSIKAQSVEDKALQELKDTLYNPRHNVWCRLHERIRHLPVTAGIQRR